MKSNYVFRNPQKPGSMEREVIARTFCRNLESIGKYQIEQLYGESWTHLKIYAPGEMMSIFKPINEKRLRPIIKGHYVYMYFDDSATALDVRLLVGELIRNSKATPETLIEKIRKTIALKLLRFARRIFPTTKV